MLVLNGKDKCLVICTERTCKIIY